MTASATTYYVASTIADMKTLPGRQLTVLVTEDGREGDFAWRSGNQKANCDADPLEGIWAAPDGEDGTNGAWERLFDGDLFVSWFGASSIGDATAAILAAANLALAYGKSLVFAPVVYNISRITFPTGVTLNFNGSVLRADGTITGSNDIVRMEGSKFDTIRVETPAITASSPLQILSNCEFDSAYLIADAQSANHLTFHSGALRLLGDNITSTGTLYVENFDAAGLIGGNSAVIFGSNIHLNRVQCRSMVRGFLWRNVTNFSARELWGDVLSPNYTFETRAPMFGTAAAQNGVFNSIFGQDASEHTFRIGGQVGSTLATKNITIGHLTSINSRRCAAKVNVDGLVDTRLTGIDIGTVVCVNASFGSTPSANEDALRVEDTDGGIFGPVLALNVDYGVSCYHGIMIANCNNVSIRPGSYIRDCAGSGVYITDSSEYIVGNVSHINVGKTTVLSGANDACWIDADSTTIEDIIVDVDSTDTNGYGWRVDANAVVAPVILRGNTHGATSGLYTGSSDVNIIRDFGADTPSLRLTGVSIYVDSQTATYGNAYQTILMNKATANSYEIPPDSAVPFPIGTFINVCQYGAGLTSISAGIGVTIRSAVGLALGGQYAVATVQKIAADEWVAAGQLVP